MTPPNYSVNAWNRPQNGGLFQVIWAPLVTFSNQSFWYTIQNKTKYQLHIKFNIKLHGFNIFIYNIDKSVLVENRPLIEFIQDYIRDSWVWRIFHILTSEELSMMSFPTFKLLFVQKYSSIILLCKNTHLMVKNNILLTYCTPL